MEKDGPLDGRKYNKNNKRQPKKQVTPKKYFLKALGPKLITLCGLHDTSY